MRKLIRQLARWLVTAAAVCVILVALLVGGFRLLVAQLPGYQEQLEAWVAETAGVELKFARLDAHWGLRGPELTFHGARVGGPGQSEPFLSAAQARVRVDALALLTERRVRLTQLAFDGTRLIMVREDDGELRLQGAPLAPTARAQWTFDIPAELEVAVRDSEVIYVDRRADTYWAFSDLNGTLNRVGDAVLLRARARPPGTLATRVDVVAEADLDAASAMTGDWRLNVDLTDLVLEELLRAEPGSHALPTQGRGDVSVDLSWRAGALARAAVGLDLEGLSIGGAAAPAHYERLALDAQWTEIDGGWRVVVEDLALRRDGRSWPQGVQAEVTLTRDQEGLVALSLASDFLRLEDLLAALPPGHVPEAFAPWLAGGTSGDLADVKLSAQRGTDGWEYLLDGRFENLDLVLPGAMPALSGLSGELRADPRSGALRLASRDLAVDWPQLFRDVHRIDDLSGLVVWRQGRDGVRVVSDNLVIANADANTWSSFELTWPLDGGSPVIDLESTVTNSTVPAVRKYLPVTIMSPGLVEWLDQALAGGRIVSADVSLFGPISAFPFDGGEGQLRVSVEVEDGVLDYVDEWPVAADLNGTVEFVNAAFAARGRGRVLGNASENVRVGIADMREAVLTLEADSEGPLPDVLAFLREAPHIARHLGPEFERVDVLDGIGNVSLNLALPIAEPAAFELNGQLAMRDGMLAIAGFGPRASEITGTLRFDNGTVIGDGIAAVLLDGPVTVSVASVNLPGYRARISLDGEIDAATVASEFGFPVTGYVAGQTRWQGDLLLPVNAGNGGLPVRATVNSNLSGIALRLPQPFAKAPADAVGLRLEFVFAAADRIELRGDFGVTRRVALAFRDLGPGFRLERGVLRFGGGWPELPTLPGLVIDGTLGAMHLADWLDLADGAGAPGDFESLLRSADLEFTDLNVFNQQLGPTRLRVRRQPLHWSLDIDSAPVAGNVLLPRDFATRAPLVATMQRVNLTLEGNAGLIETDPRELPGLKFESTEFAIGPRHFGRVEAEVAADPDGLRLVVFNGTARSFEVQGSGGWFNGPDGARSELEFRLRSTDVAGSLDELGFAHFAEGQGGEISANVRWPGPPSGAWSQHVSGELAVRVNTGSLVDLQPGAGRVIGLMSITALPRRLALDFRDVFQRGLVFDQISGDFLLVDGNAYTSNMTLTGPAVEIGLAGRTGLRDQDYRQHAVVTAEPGKVLPTVGGLLGGPGVGAALLIFTQIFREPLKNLGRVSYCVTGSWDDPQVERLGAQQGDAARACADEVPEVLQPTAAEAALR
jgi:uncharacterized protein (TIGR02099 family)